MPKYTEGGDLMIEPSEFLVFTVERVPGRGIGMIARYDIDKGTRILVETPFCTLKLAFNNISETIWQTKFIADLDRLGVQEQTAFNRLFNPFPDEGAFGTLRTNAFLVTRETFWSNQIFQTTSEAHLFRDASRINHSCRPNTNWTLNKSQPEVSVYAMEDIPKGTEITRSYLPHEMLCHEDRQTFLQREYGFDCACKLCTLCPELRLQSDDRRIAIQMSVGIIRHKANCLTMTSADSMQQVLSDLQLFNSRMQIELSAKADDYQAKCLRITAREGIQLVSNALKLIREEGISLWFSARLHLDAFHIATENKDEVRAKIFLERFLIAMVICEGTGEGSSNADYSDYYKLLENKEETGACGTSKQLELTPARVLRGEDTYSFAKWLWYQ